LFSAAKVAPARPLRNRMGSRSFWGDLDPGLAVYLNKPVEIVIEALKRLDGAKAE
jgi:hypothetical protein